MPDSYLFLLANLLGDVFFDNRRTILYRQHEKNRFTDNGIYLED